MSSSLFILGLFILTSQTYPSVLPIIFTQVNFILSVNDDFLIFHEVYAMNRPVILFQILILIVKALKVAYI